MKSAIIGTVGVPGRYGGFETLTENLVRFHETHNGPGEITVYCSAPAYDYRPKTYRGARLRYLPLKANGIQSIPYDMLTMLDAVARRHDALLILGVSGAALLPLVRLLAPRCRIVTNIDGLEWKRDKWRGVAKWYLRLSEKLAVRWSHAVVADNLAIAQHVRDAYGHEAEVIAYGGDHAVAPVADRPDRGVLDGLPPHYALGLCRIEPENNVAMILEAFARADRTLVFVGNWAHSAYGQRLKVQFAGRPNIHLLDPVYDPATLQAIRRRAQIYVHGHSAGGTNPALVEMMHFGVHVLAYDCPFNRFTTEQAATYFSSADDLCEQVKPDNGAHPSNGTSMLEIAEREYTWDGICARYFTLLTQKRPAGGTGKDDA